jgi:hypothetical protein
VWENSLQNLLTKGGSFSLFNPKAQEHLSQKLEFGICFNFTPSEMINLTFKTSHGFKICKNHQEFILHKSIGINSWKSSKQMVSWRDTFVFP